MICLNITCTLPTAVESSNMVLIVTKIPGVLEACETYDTDGPRSEKLFDAVFFHQCHPSSRDGFLHFGQYCAPEVFRMLSWEKKTPSPSSHPQWRFKMVMVTRKREATDPSLMAWISVQRLFFAFIFLVLLVHLPFRPIRLLLLLVLAIFYQQEAGKLSQSPPVQLRALAKHCIDMKLAPPCSIHVFYSSSCFPKPSTYHLQTFLRYDIS